MDVDYRQGRPEDAAVVAPLIYSSGPAAFDYVFSHRTRMNAVAFLEKVFRQEHGEFGYATHTVGVLDGNVVAVGAIYSGQSARAFFMAAARQLLSCYGPWQGIAASRRGLQFERLCPPPTGDLLYLTHLGVAPECRGHGIGQSLIKRLLISAPRSTTGHTTVALDVSCENPRAQALYERIGFEVIRERHSTLRNSTATVPSQRRMELVL